MNKLRTLNPEFIAHRSQVNQREMQRLAKADFHIVAEKPSILIVEDDRVIQTYLKYQFEKLGCTVLIAGDAQTAFALYRPGLHLALIDLNLPDLPGVTVANWIRRQEMGTDEHLSLIGHTSFLTEEIEYRCFVSGMDHAIRKLKTDMECQSLLHIWLPDLMLVN